MGVSLLRTRLRQGLYGLAVSTCGYLLISTGLTGCAPMPQSMAQPAAERSNQDGPPAVQTAIAKPGAVEVPLAYTGTTRPAQQVTLRARVDGQIVNLQGDVGDRVERGDILARLDGDLLSVAVNEAQAELAARNSEIAQAQASVSDAQALVVQAQAQLNQAQAEAQRLQRLAAAGASSQQAAEQAVLALETARQAVRSAQQQVISRQQAVNAVQGRFQAQRAVLDQTQQRLAYAGLAAPISGVILARLVEPGDYVEAGADLFSLADLSRLTVTVQVSELDLSRISLGQSAQVRLDAFPEQTLSGRVTQISPVADGTSRLVPMEVSIANPDGRVGSGLLARISFSTGNPDRVVVPEKALTFAPNSESPTVFVMQPGGEQATVVARPVQLGRRLKDQVEILSGLSLGETYVNNSDAPLEDGQRVRLSILSEVSE